MCIRDRAKLKAIAPSENAHTSIQSMVQRSERGNTAALTDCGNGMTAPFLWLPIYLQFPCLPGANACLLQRFSQAFSPAPHTRGIGRPPAARDGTFTQASPVSPIRTGARKFNVCEM